jgi:glycine/D-amino acid oxidase-like deaminating enzyme
MQRIVIVGGGVLGTMHAVAARRLGHEVVHLEREAGARGASVRNFGLIWVSGRAAGPELELALRARARWEELAADVPAAGFRPHGSLTLAASEPELGLLKEAAAQPDATLRGYELLDPAAARLLNPALSGRYASALHCRQDAIVEPREVPRARPSARSYCWSSASTAASRSATRTNTASRSRSTWTRPPTITCVAGRSCCSARRCHQRCAAGPACTARSPPMSCITGHRSRPAWCWSPAPVGAA